MFHIFIFLLLFLAGITSYIFTKIFLTYAQQHALLDIPNQRSSHTTPTPRGGGVVFSTIWSLFTFCLWAFGIISLHNMILIILPAIILGTLGFIDDKNDISARWRILTQIAAATIFVVLLGGFSTLNIAVTSLQLGLTGSFLAVIGTIWSINLYNFMDGIDGIAGIEALFILVIGGYFFWNSGGPQLAILTFGLAAAVTGFLVLNFPPAKVFMGDCGSNFLGFALIAFALLGEKLYNIPTLLWVILYGVFWFDATATLVRRLLHKEKVYQAHRLHAYQRLQLLNWSHKKILLHIIVINALLSCLSLLGYFYQQYILIFFLIGCIILLLCYLWVEKLHPMYPPKQHNAL